MADVRADRAQLIIVGGLALAVTLVALALILNSAIYTGNLATRESNHDTRAAIDQVATVDGAVERSLRWVNVHEPSAPVSNFDEEMIELNKRLRKEATDGVLASVQVTGRSEGLRFAQLDETKDFTAGGSNDGAETWTLVDNTDSTLTYAMRLEKNTLFDADLSTTRDTISTRAFRVDVTDNAVPETYEIYIYQSGVTGDAYLMTNEPGDSWDLGDTLLEVIEGSCTATGPEVVVDFTKHTFGPAPDVDSPYGVFSDPAAKGCSELDFYDAAKDYQITYAQTYDGGAATVRGEYEGVFTQTYPHPQADNFYDVGSGEPFAHGALTSADLNLVYETDDVQYETEWSVTPSRQRIFTGTAPVIQLFDVAHSGSTDFEVDWEATDADGDLNEVTVTLYNRTSETVNDSRSYTTGDPELDGDSGSDSGVTLSDPDGSTGHTYEVHIRVTDDKGHVTHEKEVVNV